MQTINAFENQAFVRSTDGLNRISVQSTIHGNAVSNIRKRVGKYRPRGESVLVTVPDSSVEDAKGMTPEQLEVGSRTSVFLKKTLRGTNHSPYSLWPSGRRPSMEPDFASQTPLHFSNPFFNPTSPEIRQRKSSSSGVSFQMASSVPTTTVIRDKESRNERRDTNFEDK